MSIDVSPFFKKLELLQEYIFLKIDGCLPSSIWIDYDAIPKINHYSFEDIYMIYQQTGNIIYSSQKYPEPKFIPLTFEEFLKHKKK